MLLPSPTRAPELPEEGPQPQSAGPTTQPQQPITKLLGPVGLPPQGAVAGVRTTSSAPGATTEATRSPASETAVAHPRLATPSWGQSLRPRVKRTKASQLLTMA